MVGYIVRRVVSAIPTLLGVSIGIFLMVRLLPGDIIDILFGGDLSASEEVKDQAREQLGLNGSYPEQYWRWISGIVQGDFGFSLRNTEPVSNVILDALPVTLELLVLGLLIAVVVGVPLGVISAVKRDSAADYTARVDLTEREVEVLRLIARGYSYKEVAARLYISVKTVESHVSAVLRKLQLSSRHELSRWASDRRLV